MLLTPPSDTLDNSLTAPLEIEPSVAEYFLSKYEAGHSNEAAAKTALRARQISSSLSLF